MLVVNFKISVYVWEGEDELFKILLGGDIPTQCSKSLMTTKAGPDSPEMRLEGSSQCPQPPLCLSFL